MAERRFRMLVGWVAAVALWCGAACAAPLSGPAPARVVSMNACTDQLAMLIAEPGQLISVSYLAVDPRVSALHRKAQAEGFVLNHGLAEQIFLMKPDLVLAGAYSARASTAMLRRLGFRIEVFQPAYSFDDIRANIRRVGRLLGREARAAELVGRIDEALAALPVAEPGAPSAAYYRENGYSIGANALFHEVLRRGGWRNAGAGYGLIGVGKLPLEVLVTAPPDALIAAAKPRVTPALASEILRHPALRKTAASRATLPLEDALTLCGAPFTVQAARDFAAARAALHRQAAR